MLKKLINKPATLKDVEHVEMLISAMLRLELINIAEAIVSHDMALDATTI